MDTLIKADIFFFITSVAVLMLLICGIAIFFYLFQIVRNIAEMSERVKREIGEAADDFSAFRLRVKEGGMNAMHWFDFFKKYVSSDTKKTTPQKGRKESKSA